MCRTRGMWVPYFFVLVSFVFVAGVSACGEGRDLPVPSESQIVGSWSNSEGDWILFEEGGQGVISPGAQLQLSEIMKKDDIKSECSFSWRVEAVPAGGEEWVSLTFATGQCGFSGPGEFGLYFYRREESGELRLSPAVEFPKPEEIYTHAAVTR